MTTEAVSYPAGDFTTLATIDGFAVIDGRGRVYAERPTRASANGIAYLLNGAARQGPQALARVLSRGRHKWVGGED